MSSTRRNTEFHPHRLIPNCLTNSCYYYFFKWGGGGSFKTRGGDGGYITAPQQPSESYSQFIQFSLFSVYFTGGELGAWQRLINPTGLPVPSHQRHEDMFSSWPCPYSRMIGILSLPHLRTVALLNSACDDVPCLLRCVDGWEVRPGVWGVTAAALDTSPTPGGQHGSVIAPLLFAEIVV